MKVHAEDEMQKAEILRGALYSHSRQVREYIDTSLVRIASYEGELRSTHEAEFAARGRLLVMQLKSLLMSAQRSGLLRGMMNLEQLEAQIEAMQMIVRNATDERYYKDMNESSCDAA